ncbi:hypothetical protein GO730_26115 [Spirosoma sp. HMF3257]|uniref:Uncharacterized protein n=1 Tax=Spirosoma telluris TaxID=2183553 RepID=A0A327NQQ4_9BACT|nr:hypothetical protein [Spirosoma telluris]RAI76769.1 hypothetical protein HMF3257_26045 [Spirosoma telluris]
MADVIKILKDLEYKAVGVDPITNEMPTGYFVSFRNVGLPIIKDDFDNPWTPLGANLAQINSSKPPVGGSPDTTGVDPGTVQPKSASQQLEENKIMVAGIAKSMQAYLNTFMLTDNKLSMSNDYHLMPNASKINDSWYAIINGANAIVSDMEFNDSIKATIEKAKSVLSDKDGNTTPKFDQYLRYRDEYQSKVKAYQRAFAGSLSDPMQFQMFPIQGRLYEDDVNFAREQWVGLGHVGEIEEALKTLSGQGIDPSLLLITRAKNKYENSLVNFPNIGNLPYTFMIPNKWYSAFEDGWTKYTSVDFHSESHVSSSSTSIGANVGFNLGFWQIGGSFNSDKSKSSMDIQISGLEISFEYATADIQRPWLDTSLLNLHNWFLVGDYRKNCISDGTFGQQLVDTTSESTFLPSIVTSFVLIRNLTIKFNEASQHADSMNNTISGGGSVGWGPFCIGGHYSHSNSESNFKSDISGSGIFVEGVQLVGYVSTIVPASPSLDSKEYMKKKADTQPVQ